MDLIFCKLEEAQKRGFNFLQAKKTQKNGFNCFTSLKKLKKMWI